MKVIVFPVLAIYLNISQSSYYCHWNKNNLVKNQLCNHLSLSFFRLLHFQIKPQNVYSPTVNLDQLSNLNIGFMSVLILLIDIDKKK